MNKELQTKILSGKRIENTYLIKPNESYKINGSILPGIEAFDLFDRLEDTTQNFLDYYSNLLKDDESLYIKIHLIYIGEDNISNDFNSFVNNNKSRIIGVHHYPTETNERFNVGYVLPYYEVGSFYVDFEYILNKLEEKNISFDIYSTDNLYELILKLNKKRNYTRQLR